MHSLKAFSTHQKVGKKEDEDENKEKSTCLPFKLIMMLH